MFVTDAGISTSPRRSHPLNASDPIVSSDIIGRRCGSLVDGLSTKVLDVDGKQLVKVISWYDNEMSYTAQMVRTAKYLMKGKEG